MTRLLRLLTCALAVALAGATSYAAAPRPVLYLLPGTGADERLFHRLDLGAYDTVNVRLPIPLRRETLAEYAARIAREQIDTTRRPFALLGVSLGGMIATELAEQLEPDAVVIVASAKTRRELPPGYRLGRRVPVHRLVGGRTMRWFTRLVQPRFEPMAPKQRDLFIEMLYAKDPAFLRRAVAMMVTWDRTVAPPRIVHLHGEHDRTLPIEHTDPTLAVRGEGHMLTYSRPGVVELVLAEAVR